MVQSCGVNENRLLKISGCIKRKETQKEIVFLTKQKLTLMSVKVITGVYY